MTKAHLFVQRVIAICCMLLAVFLPVYIHAEVLNGVINKGGVNIRTDSTISAESIGVLRKGEKVKIVKNRFSWYKIILPYRFICYASSGYLKKSGVNSAVVEATVLNLRNKPSFNSAIIGKAKKGTVLHLIKEQNGWAQVKGFPHTYGWVHRKFINLIPEKTVQEKTENNHPSTNDKNKMLTVQNKKPNTNRKKIENYDYFEVKGTIYKLDKMENCPANYKLRNEFATFFLKADDTNKMDNFLKKEVTIKGKRLYEECSYIYIEDILLSK